MSSVESSDIESVEMPSSETNFGDTDDYSRTQDSVDSSEGTAVEDTKTQNKHHSPISKTILTISLVLSLLLLLINLILILLLLFLLFKPSSQIEVPEGKQLLYYNRAEIYLTSSTRGKIRSLDSNPILLDKNENLNSARLKFDHSDTQLTFPRAGDETSVFFVSQNIGEDEFGLIVLASGKCKCGGIDSLSSNVASSSVESGMDEVKMRKGMEQKCVKWCGDEVKDNTMDPIVSDVVFSFYFSEAPDSDAPPRKEWSIEDGADENEYSFTDPPPEEKQPKTGGDEDEDEKGFEIVVEK